MAAHLQGAVSGTSRPQQIGLPISCSLSLFHTHTFFLASVFSVSRIHSPCQPLCSSHAQMDFATSTMSQTLCPPEPPHTTSRLASASRCTHAHTQTNTQLHAETHTDIHSLPLSLHTHSPLHPGQVQTHLKQIYIGATC